MLAGEGTLVSVQAKRWTREEYERMVELGLLAPDSHVQLIDGEARLYARAGIPEYWVVALQERILEVFTGPGAAGYERHVVLQASDTVGPTAKPDAKIDIASLLP
jgi:Uma2 family endonuclease